MQLTNQYEVMWAIVWSPVLFSEAKAFIDER